MKNYLFVYEYGNRENTIRVEYNVPTVTDEEIEWLNAGIEQLIEKFFDPYEVIITPLKGK